MASKIPYHQNSAAQTPLEMGLNRCNRIDLKVALWPLRWPGGMCGP